MTWYLWSELDEKKYITVKFTENDNGVLTVITASGLSKNRQNYLIIEQLLGNNDWEQAAKVPTRVGYHEGRKVKMNILKIGSYIKSSVGFHDEEYVVLRLYIDKAQYDLKLTPNTQIAYVWVYHDGIKRYDVRKTESSRAIKRQKMLSRILHVSLKKLSQAEIKLDPKPGSKPWQSFDRRKGQKYESPKRRITD